MALECKASPSEEKWIEDNQRIHAARHTKLDAQDGNQSVIEATVDALIHDASGGGGGGDSGDNDEDDLITREQSRDIFD